MDLGYVVLVIECDEHAHRSSGYSCETKREMQLLNAYKRPLERKAVMLDKREWSRRTTVL